MDLKEQASLPRMGKLRQSLPEAVRNWGAFLFVLGLGMSINGYWQGTRSAVEGYPDLQEALDSTTAVARRNQEANARQDVAIEATNARLDRQSIVVDSILGATSRIVCVVEGQMNPDYNVRACLFRQRR